MNPCILFIDPSHGSADRYLPVGTWPTAILTATASNTGYESSLPVHSGLERLGVLRGSSGGYPGRGWPEAVLSSLASDRTTPGL